MPRLLYVVQYYVRSKSKAITTVEHTYLTMSSMSPVLPCHPKCALFRFPDPNYHASSTLITHSPMLRNSISYPGTLGHQKRLQSKRMPLRHSRNAQGGNNIIRTMTLAIRLLTWKYCEPGQAEDLDAEEMTLRRSASVLSHMERIMFRSSDYRIA